MNHCILLMGGNLGNVPLTFSQAKELVTEKIGSIVHESSLYSSAAWGFHTNDLFYNQVLGVNTLHSANLVLSHILAIETYLGRPRKLEKGYQPRTIDIDILFFNQDIIDEDHLKIPHPRLHMRNFTLIPLIELYPDLSHPILQLTMKQLLEQSTDLNQVQKI